jgi:hypothetical protein
MAPRVASKLTSFATNFHQFLGEPVKKIPFVLTLIAALGLTAAAQDAKAPMPTLGRNGDGSACDTRNVLPDGLVFYGGDANGNDPNVQGFANGNTLLVPNTTTYGAVKVPKTTHGLITGIMFAVSAISTPGNAFDPDIATYDIRVSVSEGNSGTSIASGSGRLSLQLGGQCPAIYWASSVSLTSPLRVTPGATYWFNLSPQCTDPNNPDCQGEPFFVFNTTQETNGINAWAQPSGQMFFNSEYFGYTWANWCDPALGQNTKQCARLSFGLMGHN